MRKAGRSEGKQRLKDIVFFEGSSQPCCYPTNFLDPRGRPTVTVGSDHYFCTCCLYIRLSQHFKIFQNKTKFKWKHCFLLWDCGSGRMDHWWHTCLAFSYWIEKLSIFTLHFYVHMLISWLLLLKYKCYVGLFWWKDAVIIIFLMVWWYDWVLNIFMQMF